MRSRTRFLALLLLGLLLAGTVVVPRVVRFVRIFGPHSGPALTQEEIEAAYNRKRGNDDDDVLPQRIPKIIHQIFHNWRDLGNEIIPSDWDAVRETCRFHNPDFEHRLWTESASLAFIGEHYPWFLDTYRGYGFPVQRVDALRYFLMLKIGGFYIDLDNVSLFLLLFISLALSRSRSFSFHPSSFLVRASLLVIADGLHPMIHSCYIQTSPPPVSVTTQFQHP